jgi:hypothetical protein
MIDPDIEFYFCTDHEASKARTIFAITPKEYFDKKGFLYDSSSFDPKIPDFQRVADSTFEYVGTDEQPTLLLLQNGRFMWRDMLAEIGYTYIRRRLLGIDKQEEI